MERQSEDEEERKRRRGQRQRQREREEQARRVGGGVGVRVGGCHRGCACTIPTIMPRRQGSLSLPRSLSHSLSLLFQGAQPGRPEPPRTRLKQLMTHLEQAKKTRLEQLMTRLEQAKKTQLEQLMTRLEQAKTRLEHVARPESPTTHRGQQHHADLLTSPLSWRCRHPALLVLSPLLYVPPPAAQEVTGRDSIAI